LQHAGLGFDETIKKARNYMGIKDVSKPKKAFVRFAGTERDPAVNVITMDLDPVMNCLKNFENRIEKIERDQPQARPPTPPSRSTLPAPPQSTSNQRGRSSARSQNDNTGNRRVEFEDFDDVLPPNHPTSPQPRRFQTPPVGWNDINYQPPMQAWDGAGPRFQGTPPWWTKVWWPSAYPYPYDRPWQLVRRTRTRLCRVRSVV